MKTIEPIEYVVPIVLPQPCLKLTDRGLELTVEVDGKPVHYLSADEGQTWAPDMQTDPPVIRDGAPPAWAVKAWPHWNIETTETRRVWSGKTWERLTDCYYHTSTSADYYGVVFLSGNLDLYDEVREQQVPTGYQRDKILRHYPCQPDSPLPVAYPKEPDHG